MIGIIHLRLALGERWGFVGVFAVFCVSLTLRTLDMRLCQGFPYGTHFIWHLLNGVVV